MQWQRNRHRHEVAMGRREAEGGTRTLGGIGRLWAMAIPCLSSFLPRRRRRQMLVEANGARARITQPDIGLWNGFKEMLPSEARASRSTRINNIKCLGHCFPPIATMQANAPLIPLVTASRICFLTRL